MAEDWTAVAEAINEQVNKLGWRQRELAERSQVSQATVREIQHHTVERRRSARTLESLSTALGLHPQHLEAVLHQQEPPAPDDPVTYESETLSARLDAVRLDLREIVERLDGLSADIATVKKHVGADE